MKKLNVALLGFGSVAQSFAKILLEKEKEIEQKYDTSVNVVAITTKTRGNLVDAWGIDLERVMNNIQETGVLPKQQEDFLERNSMNVAELVNYDVLIEMTPLEFATGHMATEHIMAALKRGKHVICANKGPLAWHYKELNDLAEKNGCKFLFETTVMDGTPVFGIARENMKMCEILEIEGILSSTANYVLSDMELGKTMKEALAEGKKMGFVEANPKDDIEGKDLAAKICAMANILMDADLTPDDIEIAGIDNITKDDIDKAAEKGNAIKLMCRAYRKDGKVAIKVGPEEISKQNIYAMVNGKSQVISITTDMMGTMTVIEEAGEVEQSGYGVFSDLLTIIEDLED